MSELRELYQEMILDHGRRPRNFGSLEGAAMAEGHNPLCGDKIKVYLSLSDDTIRDVRFLSAGCAISTASASLMSERIKGLTTREVGKLFEQFHALVTQDPEAQTVPASLGKLMVFSGVREFPSRIKCATLPWHALLAAMVPQSEKVSTE